jgi:hypothetical protein
MNRPHGLSTDAVDYPSTRPPDGDIRAFHPDETLLLTYSMA